MPASLSLLCCLLPGRIWDSFEAGETAEAAETAEEGVRMEAGRQAGSIRLPYRYYILTTRKQANASPRFLDANREL
jgi:hypothetical protein